MGNSAVQIKQELSKLLAQALKISAEEISFELPREEKFGDISTTVILRLAKERKTNPRALAEETLKALLPLVKDSGLKERIEKISVEGPGYINFYYSARQTAEVISKIKEHGNNFGKPEGILPKKIILEFVSANPTGPLTVAHGRQAALGDSLARILKFCGHQVTTEYYNNDEGVQIQILGQSLYARVLGQPIPENGYQGEYLMDVAEKLKEAIAKEKITLGKDADSDLKFCEKFAREDIMEGIRKDLLDFGVSFDNTYSQEALGRSGKVEKALEALKAKNVTYEKDGAWWFRSTDFGDDKDRVLVKSDKSYTYLTPDVAYHHDKFARGFEELVNIWGPDHHGYIARLKASQAALGHNPESIHILIAQLVTLYEEGRQVRMSTRAGEFVTLREILDEVGKDAGRFFFLMRKFDTHLDFDLALAKSQTPDNPVFYIQYAHARIESIKNTYLERVGVPLQDLNPECLSKLTDPSELKLMRHLAAFEETVLGAERTLEPYRLVPYLMELAGLFHRFYTDNRVVTEDASLTQARMMLCIAAQSVIRLGLELLGVSAPLKM